MARSEAQIEQSLKDSFSQINPGLDLKVGPTYDYTMRPIPRELAFVESQVDRLLRFYSSDFADVATPSEARDFATNFGVGASLGERATGTVIFFRNSPPSAGTTLLIPVGMLVATRDAQYIFQTMEAKQMQGDFADTYFNPQTNKYEIEVIVQAIAPGTFYNLTEGKITQMLSGGNADFDGVEQRFAVDGGTEPETTSELATRVIKQFKGINLNSVTGIETLAKRFVPTGILDTNIIRPTDRLEFRRPTTGPALDLCIKGFETKVFEEEYFSTGGESMVTLKTTTAKSISQVRVNDVVLDTTLWTFIDDTSREYGGSTRAKPKIQLAVPLVANDILDVVGTQNYLLDKVQAIVTTSEDALFKTDILVRSFTDLPVVVGIEVRIKNSPLISISEVENLLPTLVSEYIEPEEIPSTLRANSLSDYLKLNIPEVDSVLIYEFRRKFTSIDSVETISPLKNEIPRFDSTASRLIVRS